MKRVLTIFITLVVSVVIAGGCKCDYRLNNNILLDANKLNAAKLSYEKSVEDKIKNSTPKEALLLALKFYGVEHPNVVFSQAVLETGNFKSNVCRTRNNLFGLYDSYNDEYYKFNHWSESVIAYRKYIQNKYTNKSENYYAFLKRIGYAEDEGYIEKVKKIERILKKRGGNYYKK